MIPAMRLGSRVTARTWVAPGMFLGLALTVALIFWPSTHSLLREWFETPSSAYRHGPLVALVAMWLAVRALRTHRDVSPGEQLAIAPMICLAALGIVWLIVERAGVQVGHQALLPLVLWCGVWGAFGWRIARGLIVPIGLLYSAIPVWHIGLPLLQSMTVGAVDLLLRLVGIPAYVVGDFVQIRSGIFHVEDGCAGLHYFIVGVTIGVVLGELRGDSWRVRGCLVALVTLLALVSNWLRVFIIIVAGYVTDMQHYLVRVDHGTFGWLVFAVALGVFLFIVRRWSWSADARASDAIHAPHSSPSLATAMRALLAVIAVASIGPLWGVLAPVTRASELAVPSPGTITGWSGPTDGCFAQWRPEFAGADMQAMQEYSRGGRQVCVFIANYREQRQGKELIGYGANLYEAATQVVDATTRDVHGRRVNELRLGGESAADRIVWSAYVLEGRELTRGIEVQFRYAIGTLAGAPGAGVFAISAPCVPDCASARDLLTEFLPHVTVGGAR